MGNNYSSPDSSKLARSSLPEKIAKRLNTDGFIIEHAQNNKMNDDYLSIESFDERRLVFVSVRGLFQSWREVPSIELYTALFIMQLKQKWIHQPSKYMNELQEQIGVHCCKNATEMRHFVDLLRWKDSQSLVFWMLDEAENDVTDDTFAMNPFINPIWYRFNAKLISLYDHVLGKKYDPLQFDEMFWRNETLFDSQYLTDARSILAEFYFLTMKHNTLQEIIYQSNPKTLRPVIKYKNTSLDTLSPISEEDDLSNSFQRASNILMLTSMTPSTDYEVDIDALVNEAMKCSQ